MKYLLLLTLVFSLLAGCKQRPGTTAVYHTEDLLYEEYFSNGQLKVSKQFLNEYQTDFLYLAYYEDGHLMDSVIYKDNLPHGSRIYFDQGSGLTHIENYENGILVGVNMGIYNNGVRNYEGFRKSGSKAGEWIFRNPDGITLTYEFYDSTGKLLYFRKYDERGKYQKSNGSVLIEVVQENITDPKVVFPEVVIVAAVPPGCQSIIKITQSPENPEEQILFEGELVLPRSKITIPIDEPGVHLLRFNLKVIDKASGRIEESQTDKTVSIKSS